LIERRPLAAVEHRVIREVRGRVRLVGGHQVDEGRLAHRLKRVVGDPLFADRRHCFPADGLAAQRARAVRRIDEARVRQRQQLLAQRRVEERAKVGRGPAERRAQVRTADVADEQRVARQHGVRRGAVLREVVDEQRDRLRGVPGRFERREPYAAELHAVAIVKRRERVLGPRNRAQVDGGACAVAQLEMAGDEVRVEVREEDVRNAEAVPGGEFKVLADVALRIDDGSRARLLVPDQVRCVCKAIEIELLENHRVHTLYAEPADPGRHLTRLYKSSTNQCFKLL
jgi:hypothetical protein